jgi:hypothetical protein
VNQARRVYLLLKELGLSQLIPYAIYQSQLHSGKLEHKNAQTCPAIADPKAALAKAYLFEPAPQSGKLNPAEVLKSVDEIVSGSFHPFSGTSARIELTPPGTPLFHWTKYGDTVNDLDIKTIWEPARFEWVFPLCQAYLIDPDEKYPRTFWNYFEQFIQANPENLGPNWVSGQEIALRLIPWLLAAQTFTASPQTTALRLQSLILAIWQHVSRIALTLNYSHSQNNNHLLSEALGLMIGGTIFSETSVGPRWLKQGFSEFQAGILKQVEKDGTYGQYSANYHRLILHLALLFKNLAKKNHLKINSRVEERLAAATRWLTSQMDASTGCLPNSGHNDGSNFLPFGCTDYLDYRPTAQAACRAFLGAPCLPTGQWDELSIWLGLISGTEILLKPDQLTSPAVPRLENDNAWVTLIATKYHSRPAHADLLSVDLWQEGVNLLADAGTYAYNLPEPWQNRLAGTAVHNTITVNGQDQMFRAGKFLWLERARAFPLPSELGTMAAILFCNLPIAYTQVRTVGFTSPFEFQILDRIELARLEKSDIPVTIQYLLPDWEWCFTENDLVLSNKQKQVRLSIQGRDPHDESPVPGSASLIRAGETLSGDDQSPIRGWISPTYLEKYPALSFSVTFSTTKSLEILTRVILSRSE